MSHRARMPEDSRVGPAGFVWGGKHLVVHNHTVCYDRDALGAALDQVSC